MPIVNRISTPIGEIILWRITETSSDLLGNLSLSASEQAFYEQLTTDRRRKEWLAWHAILRHEIGETGETSYSESGKPILLNHNKSISISHSGNYVALYLSDRNCGVDIESTERKNLLNAAPRFLSDSEKFIIKDVSLTNLSLVWCSKEATYKYAQIKGLDFLSGMILSELENDTIKINILDKEIVRLGYLFFETLTIVYTI